MPKLADLGFAIKIDDCTDVQRYLGTAGYMAPELYNPGKTIRSKNLYAADIFSLGVTIFALVCCYMPFSSDQPPRDVRISWIIKEDWTNYWNHHPRSLESSVEFKQMIEGCIRADPAMRWNATTLN
jgi:serine/threonine protein kinase